MKRRAYGLRTFPALKVAFYQNLGALPKETLIKCHYRPFSDFSLCGNVSAAIKSASP
jgi:hypothetical protein